MTKEQMCKVLSETYGWDLKELLKNNDSQIRTLYHSCLNENSKLRTK